MPATIDTPANARSRRTQAQLLHAARSLLERHGFEALTMAAIATEAGVTRRAAYLHFRSRAQLVSALFDHVAAEEGLHESLRRVWDAPDAAAALDEWARHIARYHTRLLAVDRAIERVRGVDDDAAQHRERVASAKLDNCRRLGRQLAAENHLKAPWTAESAADMLYALTSSDVVEALTVDRGWASEQLANHLGLLLRSTFAPARGDEL